MFDDDQYMLNAVNEIKRYSNVNRDFSKVESKKQKLESFTDVNELIESLNKEINLDFVKESEAIEDSKDLGEKKFKRLLIEPDTKIVLSLPMEAIDAFVGLEGEDLKLIKREICKKSKILAINMRLNSIKEFKYTGHLFALRNVFHEAKSAKSNNLPLDHYLILETNEALFDGSIKQNSSGIGSYRSPYSSSFTYVDGANWTPVSNSRVSDCMDALLEWYNNQSKDLHPIERAAILHAEFIRIHPFADGNGRTARLLMNYELVKNGYPSITIKAMDKEKYIGALNTAITTKDVSDLVQLMTNTMNKTQASYISIIEEKKEFERSLSQRDQELCK